MMKKIYFLIFSGIVLLSSPLLAQGIYQKGDISVNAGFSLGLIGYGYGYYGSAGFAIPLTANVEYGLNEMIGLGPYVGYMRRSYGSIDNRTSFTAIAIGGQAVFHVTPLLNELLETDINEETIDYYARVILGFETRSWRYNGERIDNLYYNNAVVPRFGPVVGVRYMFKPNLGVYGEGGRGAFGWLTLGVTLRL